MKTLIIFIISFTNIAFANINGVFKAEFKQKDMDCAIEANILQKNIKQITFKAWDELCEDQKGNSYESSLEDVTSYEKISENKLKVTQGKDILELDAIVLEFKKDFVHYNFEVETEDGHLEINESYTLKNNALVFSSIYLLDGKEIINKSGTVYKK